MWHMCCQWMEWLHLPYCVPEEGKWPKKVLLRLHLGRRFSVTFTGVYINGSRDCYWEGCGVWSAYHGNILPQMSCGLFSSLSYAKSAGCFIAH